MDIEITTLKLVKNHKGRLMEVQRNDDPNYPGFGQAYITSSHPGIIKAWYLHHTQIDQLACITGIFKLVMYSPETKEIREVVMGDESPAEPQLVKIPPGIWHGFKNIGDREGFILHLNNLPYDFDSPDEDRLEPDSAQIPYNW